MGGTVQHVGLSCVIPFFFPGAMQAFHGDWNKAYGIATVVALLPLTPLLANSPEWKHLSSGFMLCILCALVYGWIDSVYSAVGIFRGRRDIEAGGLFSALGFGLGYWVVVLVMRTLVRPLLAGS